MRPISLTLYLTIIVTTIILRKSLGKPLLVLSKANVSERDSYKDSDNVSDHYDVNVNVDVNLNVNVKVKVNDQRNCVPCADDGLKELAKDRFNTTVVFYNYEVLNYSARYPVQYSGHVWMMYRLSVATTACSYKCRMRVVANDTFYVGVYNLLNNYYPLFSHTMGMCHGRRGCWLPFFERHCSRHVGLVTQWDEHAFKLLNDEF